MKKYFDYVFDEIIEPILMACFDFGAYVLNLILVLLFLITLPIWIIPYLIIKGARK